MDERCRLPLGGHMAEEVQERVEALAATAP
jgi:hypothetical protein